MREEDVAAWLQEHPDFFEHQAEMLAGMVIPHPYGGRTISLGERQLLTLREKNKALEKKLHEAVAYARENEELGLKVHQFACALFGARDAAAAHAAIVYELQERFAVPHVALRLWQDAPPSAEVLTFADESRQPVCTPRPMYDTQAWFGEMGPHLRSFAYLPLRAAEQSFGLLVLASEDAQRFYPEMGTLFLQRIAEICSSKLKSHL
jgi:uncharacterized protein YigA (DUF484 family)